MSSDGPLLELSALRAGHDGVAVVHDIDMVVRAGEVVVLLGANGAGKSTTLQTVSGLLPVLGGEVRFDGGLVAVGGRRSAAAAAAIARAGLVHVPEDRGLFPDLTGHEHLRLAHPRGASSKELGEVLARFPGLERVMDRRAGLLSGGEQQMLALAKALHARPKLLLVDELSLGLAPLIVQRLLPVLRQIANEHGLGVLLVEQHIRLALSIADRGYLMQRGRIAMSGTAVEMTARRDELEAGYLGEENGRSDAG